MLSVEFNTKLLKLHLRWPERDNHSKSDEPMAFFKWLFLNHYERPEVELLQNVEDAQRFLQKNIKVLRARPTKEKRVNSRFEPRIGNDVQAVVSVDICDENIELVGMNIDGRTLDLSLHGMRVSIETLLPEGSLLGLRIETDRGDIFYLKGESRWVRPFRDELLLVGIRIFETEGFEQWRDQFGLNFVAPRIGRNYKPKHHEPH